MILEFDQDKITIGITDYAQSQLGDIIFVEMPLAGDIFTAGNTFGEIEAVKTVSELYAPLSGTVIEVNDCIEKENLCNAFFEVVLQKIIDSKAYEIFGVDTMDYNTIEIEKDFYLMLKVL